MRGKNREKPERRRGLEGEQEGGGGKYLVTCPSLHRTALICERRLGSSVAAVCVLAVFGTRTGVADLGEAMVYVGSKRSIKVWSSLYSPTVDLCLICLNFFRISQGM